MLRLGRTQVGPIFLVSVTRDSDAYLWQRANVQNLQWSLTNPYRTGGWFSLSSLGTLSLPSLMGPVSLQSLRTCAPGSDFPLKAPEEDSNLLSLSASPVPVREGLALFNSETEEQGSRSVVTFHKSTWLSLGWRPQSFSETSESGKTNSVGCKNY